MIRSLSQQSQSYTVISLLEKSSSVKDLSKHQLLLDALPFSVFWKDRDSIFMGCNLFFAKNAGFIRTEEIVGRSTFEIGIPERASMQAIDEDRKIVFTGIAELNSEMEIPHPDGTIHTNQVTKVPLRDKYGQIIGVVAFFIDITAKKKAERETAEARLLAEQRLYEVEKAHEELRRNQETFLQTKKMASLGVMASGIAHEVNNPLAIIKSNAEALQLSLELGTSTPEELVANAQRISLTVDRIAKIILGLRTFARDSNQDQFEKTSLGKIVEDTLSFCSAKFKNSGVQLTLDMPSELPSLTAQPVQLSQVLLNLLNNSFDAVEGLPKKWIRIEAKLKDQGVELAVVDSGSGISPEIASRMMEPFFTTKEVGKGTGLGLSISRGILEAHKGKIYIDSEDSNTRIGFWLPL